MKGRVISGPDERGTAGESLTRSGHQMAKAARRPEETPGCSPARRLRESQGQGQVAGSSFPPTAQGKLSRA